jgi:hypothetical protein
MSEEVDRLYGLPIDEFVAERNATAKRLRAEGHRDEAAEVAKLRKPSVAAWAANQALRSQPAARRELFAAGEALADAQASLLKRSTRPAAFHEAVDRHRTSIEQLVDAARGLLDSSGRGLSDQTLERVRETLTAASLDPLLRDEAEAARLMEEHSYSGFGAFAAPPADAPPSEEDVAEARRRASAARAVERKVAAKSRALAAAERRLEGARRVAEEAAAKLAAAEAAVAAAQGEHGEAVDELERARSNQ